MNTAKLWTKSFIIISIMNFFVALTFYLLMTTLTIYAVEQFKASQSEAGLASSIFVIGALFSRLFAGKYIEVVGRKKMLYGGLFLFLLTTILYFFIDYLAILLVNRFIHGAAFGVSATAMATAVMDLIPNERRGEGTSYFSLSATGATAFGPFLGLLIVQQGNFDYIFAACTVFSILTIIFTIFADIPEAQLTPEQRQDMKRGFKLLDFFEIKALPISSLMIIMGIAYSSIISFINSYAIDIQQEKAASLFFIVYAIFLFISRPLTGKLLDIKGDNIVIYPALLIYSISLALLSIAQNGFVFLLAAALLALGFGTFMSCAQAIAIKESPKHRVGLATSTFFICADGGLGVGPFFIGLLIPIIDFRGMYMILAIGVALSIVLYYFMHGRKAALRKKLIAHH